jgi:hypothetical protein
MEPPKSIDGAEVLCWAWSGNEPFGLCGDIPIHGFAVCRYASGSLYRFSCDRDWESVNDSPQDTLEQAMSATPLNYRGAMIRWVRRGAG